jgi:YHS domain-containing protein
MPSNAMPNSYRNPETSVGPPAFAAAAPAKVAAGVGAGSGLATGQAATPNASVAAPAASAGAAAALAASASKPPKAELPAGSPPMVFDGFCPVTLKTLNRWVEGDRQYGAVHRGRTYLFAGAQQRDQFLADPDVYSPVFAGLDPVLLIDKQQAKEGSRALGYRYGDAFYLFSSKETMQKFKEAPHAYAAGVRQAMNRIDATGGGTLRR